jgi:hypothetical protein
MSEITVNERWRKPANVISVENDPVRLVKEGNRVMHDVMFVVDADTKKRMEEGRVCAYCTEPFPEAFPALCNFCGFPVRDQQTHYLSKQSVGDVRIGSKVKLQEEQDRLTELAEYENKTGIILPDSTWNRTGDL